MLHAFLISALDGCEWTPSRAGHFIPGERKFLPTSFCLDSPVSNLTEVYTVVWAVKHRAGRLTDRHDFQIMPSFYAPPARNGYKV
jgi:hypothetical protein